MDGSGSSTTGNGSLTYHWSLESSPPADFAFQGSGTRVSPSFVPPVEGRYTAILVVSDGASRSAPDEVLITVSSGNSPPVAGAGPDQNVATGDLVALSGEASTDSDGDMLSYEWSLSSVPVGSVARLSHTSAESPTFTVDLDGSYIVELIVRDGIEASAPVSLTIVSTTRNSTPVAAAGPDQEVIAGSAVALDGSSSSDADGDSITYEWTLLSSPAGSSASLDGTDRSDPSFTADAAGSYVMSLAVSDGLVTSDPDNVRVDVTRPGVQLFRKSSGFFGNGAFNETALPYSSSGTSTVSKSGIPTPTTHSFETFKLMAKGGDFTIDNLIAVDATSRVTPYFTNISDGYVLTDGDEVQFELVSPLTRGATVMLEFSFDILETGERFVSRQTFTSN